MGPPFSTILCAVDLDENSLTALGVAAKIAQRDGARLVALYVVPMDLSPTRKPNLDLFLAKEGEDRRFLERLARDRFGDISFEVLTRSGHPDVAILHVADEIHAELLVMATHTRGVIPHQLVGSVAEKVLRQSKCPVLMVPAPVRGNVEMVSAWMTADPATTSPEATLAEVYEKMREGGFRCMPVVKSDRLVGMITDRDIRNRAREMEDVEVNQAMTDEVVTVAPATSVQEAARLLLECKVGGLPVLEDGRLVGIITVEDVIKFMLNQV
jgi:acetoin utilization protein AcuB